MPSLSLFSRSLHQGAQGSVFEAKVPTFSQRYSGWVLSLTSSAHAGEGRLDAGSSPFGFLELPLNPTEPYRAGARWNVAPGAVLGLKGTHKPEPGERGQTTEIMLRNEGRW